MLSLNVIFKSVKMEILFENLIKTTFAILKICKKIIFCKRKKSLKVLSIVLGIMYVRYVLYKIVDITFYRNDMVCKWKQLKNYFPVPVTWL